MAVGLRGHKSQSVVGAFDPSDCIFLIAYVVTTEVERKDTWGWF